MQVEQMTEWRISFFSFFSAKSGLTIIGPIESQSCAASLEVMF